jgi:iron complex outermembrane recepter protein
MRKVFFLFLLTICYHGFSQTAPVHTKEAVTRKTELSKGVISGQITTVDNRPAAYVSVSLAEANRFTLTDENGNFSIKNLKAGVYTLTVSMIGLKTVSQQVVITDGQKTVISTLLEEDAKQLASVIVMAQKNLNDKPVTIGKIAIDPMDLPQSISVINRPVLERQQSLRLSDVLMNVNGLYMYGNTGGSQEEIGGRGYAFGSSNTFKNGIRYNNGAMPEISALERVEVIKGSAALLYGNVAAGGILNLVTKKPKFEKGGEISFRAGSYDFYKPSFDIYGPISKNIAYHFNSTYEKGRSFRNNVHSERYYINPSFLFNLRKKTDLLLEGDYLDDDRTSDFGTGAINYTVAAIPRSRFLGTPWSYYKTTQSTATATLTHHINEKWQFRSVASFQGFNSDLYGTTRPNASGQLIQTDGTWVRGLQRSRYQESYVIVQTDLTGYFKTGKIQHSLLTGFDADRYTTNAYAYSYANPAISNKNIYDTINIFNLSRYKQRNDIPEIAATTMTRTPVTRAGIYVQDLLQIGDQLKVLAGLRYSYQETNGGYIDSLLKNSRTTTSNSFDRAFSPRLGFVYQPAKTISIFGSYSNSFTLNTGTDIYLQSLAPSYINQFEAGVKTSLFKELLSANITLYKIRNSNFAQTALTDANGNPNNNNNIKELSGEVTSKGLEIDLSTKNIQGFTFMGGYSYNDTRYIKSNIYIEGSKLRYNPGHTANASVYYTFNNGTGLRGFNLGVITYYVGERVAGRSARLTVVGDTYKLMAIPDYIQVDATAGYTIDKVSLRFKVSNMFDKLSYYVHDDNSVNPIAPRIVSASIVVKL